MPIDLTCSCGRQLRVADDLAGRQGQCPACGALVEIPLPPSVSAGTIASSVDPLHAVTDRPAPQEPAEGDAPAYAVTPLPYEPGALETNEHEIERPRYRLYSPGTIGLVAFLTGPVGAFVLLILNYWRLARRRAAWITMVCGALTLVALVAISVALPDSFPSVLLGVPVFLVLWGVAKGAQGADYEAHRLQGGASASGWAAAGIGVLGVVTYLGLIFGAVFLYEDFLNPDLRHKVDFGNEEEVYYTKGATEADARALGQYLKGAKYFDGQGGKSVRLSTDGDRLVIGFVVQDWVVKDVQAHEELRQMGQQASQEAFGGRPVVVELCDEYFEVKKRL